MTQKSESPPAATLTIRRELHDGAGYTLTAAAPGVVALLVRDPVDADEACIGIDRAETRQLIADLELAAGLRPTASTVDLPTALAGSLRILLHRIDDELEKIDPTAADRLRGAMVAHLRAKQPALLAGGLP